MIDYDKHKQRNIHTDAYHQAKYQLFSELTNQEMGQVFKNPHSRHTLIAKAKQNFLNNSGTEQAWQELEHTQVNPFTRHTRFKPA